MTFWACEKVWMIDSTFTNNHYVVFQTSGFFNMRVGDDKDNYLQFIQKAHAATDPIIIIRSGKLIFGHEAQSTKGTH